MYRITDPHRCFRRRVNTLCVLVDAELPADSMGLVASPQLVGTALTRVRWPRRRPDCRPYTAFCDHQVPRKLYEPGVASTLGTDREWSARTTRRVEVVAGRGLVAGHLRLDQHHRREIEGEDGRGIYHQQLTCLFIESDPLIRIQLDIRLAD